jgi:hypothetical protein
MAAVLDIRFKELHWLIEGEREPYFHQLRDECKVVANLADDDEDEDEERPAEAPAEDMEDIAAYLDPDPRPAVVRDAANRRDALRREVEQYLQEPRLRFSQKPRVDPLVWWSQHCEKYPTVAMLAKKYLAIPSSTASSERVFSFAKLILIKKRYSMSAERLERYVFSKVNKHFGDW